MIGGLVWVPGSAVLPTEQGIGDRDGDLAGLRERAGDRASPFIDLPTEGDQEVPGRDRAMVETFGDTSTSSATMRLASSESESRFPRCGRVPPMPADPGRNVSSRRAIGTGRGRWRPAGRLGVVDHGVIEQLDTYFNVVSGRLKLREQTPGGAHLIQYERAEDPQQRESRYQVIEIEDGAQLRAVLSAAPGTNVVVIKRWRLYVWREVRIHLDQMDGLGAFIELEAVAPCGSDLTPQHALVDELRTALAIADADLVAQGYAA